VRAMILGAGLGTRLRPLSRLRPKPALPVRGLPLIEYNLELLASLGVREVLINLHHLGAELRAAAEAVRPPGMALRFSPEPRPLGTGGGIRRAARFLAGSDPSLVLAGDMILDLPLGEILELHHRRRDAVTLVLRDDPRADRFGTIGLDGDGRVRRIAGRFDVGGGCESGVYVNATVISRRALETLPARECFSHLDGWLMPLLRLGAEDIRGIVLPRGSGTWVPVGTPTEYLEANFTPLSLSYLNAECRARARGAELTPERVVGPGAVVEPRAELERVVVWDGERVPTGTRARQGVFAGGRFVRCADGAGDG